LVLNNTHVSFSAIHSPFFLIFCSFRSFLPLLMSLYPSVFFFYVALQPNAGYGFLIHEVFEITHTTRHSR
jgi:hypothetical protein